MRHPKRTRMHRSGQRRTVVHAITLGTKTMNRKETSMTRKAARLAMTALLLVVHCTRGYGQTAPPVILAVDLENIVNYEGDVSDASKLATVPTTTVGTAVNNFAPVIWLGDVVAVNGNPAK